MCRPCGRAAKILRLRNFVALDALRECLGARATQFEARSTIRGALSTYPKPVMTQTPAPQVPAVKFILEKAKGIFPDPYTWQINAWEYMFAEKSRDVLVIAGMGSGKSLIFQLLHFVKENGISFIISPLAALMKDQVL